jgi:hypothetical protein
MKSRRDYSRVQSQFCETEKRGNIIRGKKQGKWENNFSPQPYMLVLPEAFD